MKSFLLFITIYIFLLNNVKSNDRPDYFNHYMSYLNGKNPSIDDTSFDCALINHFSPIHGLSIYAGRTWKAGEVVERCQCIPIPIERCKDELDDYVEGFNSTHQCVTLGNAFIYNHIPSSDGKYLHKYGPQGVKSLIPNIVNNEGKGFVIDYVASENIELGNKMFYYYNIIII
jgi:hypothetical protein